ncbi:MAG: ABC transporter permease [Acidobacteria bacterium]|nr:ABC transporter permease [Acidobacteriota bacterium]
MNARRIRAVFRRHWYVIRHSPDEVFDILYWAFLDLLLWGLLATFLQRRQIDLPVPVGLLLGGALLWALLWRTQMGISTAFLHEVWSRNLISLLASPIRPGEYIAGAILWTIAQLAVGWTAMAVVAWTLFRFGIFSLGPALVPCLAVIMIFGVAMSLAVLGLIVRFGHRANVLAWGIGGMLMPLSAVYYPVTVLPGWAQAVAQGLPLARVFEAMREVIAGGPVPWDRLGMALALDLAYLVAAAMFARAMFATLRRRGYVTRYV